MPSFRIVEYDTPRGCAAAYYPEVNPLVPLDSTAEGSNCPTSKSVVHPARAGVGAVATPPPAATVTGGLDRGKKSDVEPNQLS